MNPRTRPTLPPPPFPVPCEVASVTRAARVPVIGTSDDRGRHDAPRGLSDRAAVDRLMSGEWMTRLEVSS